MHATDYKDPWTVLAAVRGCALHWAPEARIIGDIRAGDIERAIRLIAEAHYDERDYKGLSDGQTGTMHVASSGAIISKN